MKFETLGGNENIKTVNELISHCAGSGEDPFVYAQGRNIDLENDNIENIIKNYDYKNIKEFEVITKLAKGHECCERNCGNNFCSKNRAQMGILRFKDTNDQIKILYDGIKDESVGINTRINALKLGVDTIVTYSKDIEGLNKVLNELPNLKEILLNIDNEKDKLVMEHNAQIHRFNSVQEYIDSEFRKFTDSIEERLVDLNSENNLK